MIGSRNNTSIQFDREESRLKIQLNQQPFDRQTTYHSASGIVECDVADHRKHCRLNNKKPGIDGYRVRLDSTRGRGSP